MLASLTAITALSIRKWRFRKCDSQGRPISLGSEDALRKRILELLYSLKGVLHTSQIIDSGLGAVSDRSTHHVL